MTRRRETINEVVSKDPPQGHLTGPSNGSLKRERGVGDLRDPAVVRLAPAFVVLDGRNFGTYC